MSKAYQWILTFVLLVIAGMIIIFGIASIAVVLGFLMLPVGIMFIVRGVQNLKNNTKSVITVNANDPKQITINPFVEILAGVLLFFIGVSLAKSFIGIVFTGIAIYLIIYFLDKTFNKAT